RQIEDALELERSQLRMASKDEGADAGHVWGREAVAGAAKAGALQPGDVDVHPAREELDWRFRVVEEVERLGPVVAPDRQHRGEPPREAFDRQVVHRGDEHRLLEVREVGELVQALGEVSLRRREAHVHDVEAVLDRVAKTGDENRAAAGVAGTENAHAVELTLGREGTNDAGARRSVAAEVALLVRLDRDLAVLPALDRDGPCERPDERVVRLDPAVEDADADAAPGRISPRPLAGDLRRPLDRQLDVLFRTGGQTPRRKRLGSFRCAHASSPTTSKASTSMRPRSAITTSPPPVSASRPTARAISPSSTPTTTMLCASCASDVAIAPRWSPKPCTKPRPTLPVPRCRSTTAILARSRSGSAIAKPSSIFGSSRSSSVTIWPSMRPITRAA